MPICSLLTDCVTEGLADWVTTCLKVLPTYRMGHHVAESLAAVGRCLHHAALPPREQFVHHRLQLLLQGLLARTKKQTKHIIYDCRLVSGSLFQLNLTVLLHFTSGCAYRAALASTSLEAQLQRYVDPFPSAHSTGVHINIEPTTLQSHLCRPLFRDKPAPAYSTE